MATAMAPAPTTGAPSTEALAAARVRVRGMLTAIPAFAQLSPAEQQKLAHDMVKVVSYIADPGGVVSETAMPPAPPPTPPGPPGPARVVPAVAAFADAVQATKQNLSRSPGFAGKDFEAGAAAQGVEQFGNLVNKVDFPAFVGGLINNVFKTIVETTIEQMRAYGELVANVAKSTQDYMNENIGPGAGRDWLADRFPDLLDVETDDEAEVPGSRLALKGEDGEAALAEINGALGLEKPITDLSDPAEEIRLVNAARLAMAKSRQQLLASMVMLGINRIVVTDGTINAKVQFDMRSTDTAKRDYKASMYDRQSMRNTNTSAFGFGMFGFGGGSVNRNEQSHVATVSTALDETSESKLEMKAKLAGEVRVNFKSDYLPLEKMATPAMIGAISGNSTPVDPNPQRAAAAAAAPPPAAAPPATRGAV